MTNLWKRSLSMFLALVMVFGMLPMSVFAADGDDTTPPAIVDETPDGTQETEETTDPPCEHSYTYECSTVCADCGEGTREASHSYAEGKCAFCGEADPDYQAPAEPTPCEHDWSAKNGVCAVESCKAVCEHAEYEAGACKVCGYACVHANYEEGKCAVCGEAEPAPVEPTPSEPVPSEPAPSEPVVKSPAPAAEETETITVYFDNTVANWAAVDAYVEGTFAPSRIDLVKVEGNVYQFGVDQGFDITADQISSVGFCEHGGGAYTPRYKFENGKTYSEYTVEDETVTVYWNNAAEQLNTETVTKHCDCDDHYGEWVFETSRDGDIIKFEIPACTDSIWFNDNRYDVEDGKTYPAAPAEEELEAPVAIPEDFVDKLVGKSATEEQKAAAQSVIDSIAANAAMKHFAPELPETVKKLQITLSGLVMETAPTKITFNVEPKNAADEKVSDTGTAITFRLPVPDSWDWVKVTHGSDVSTSQAKGANGGKYVEVQSATFSQFTAEPTSDNVQDIPKEPITGTITEDMVWEDGDIVGPVTISGNVKITVKGTVSVAGTIRLSPDAISDVTFNGESGAKLIRDESFTGQMFYAEGITDNFQNLTFNNITLDGGAVWTGEVDKTLDRGTVNSGVKATGSVLYLVYANADLNNSTLQNHDDSTGEKANAVFLRYYSTIDFNDSVVRDNNSISSYYRGGVVTIRQGGTVKTNQAEVYGNSGAAGGFVGISSTGSFGGIVEVKNSKFYNNYAGNGAVFLMQCNSNIGYLQIDGCEFYNNASKTAVLTEWAYSRPFIIKDSHFHDNECAVWDCHADPILDLSGKIVIEEDADYTKYLFETPLVLGGALSDGSSITISAASLKQLMDNFGYIASGINGYTITNADLDKFVLPEGYKTVLVDVTGDGIGDAVAVKPETELIEIKLTLKNAADAEASADATVYMGVECLPVNPFAHEGLTFAGWVDKDGKAVAKQKFTETSVLTATWAIEAPVVKLSRADSDPYCNTLLATVTNKYDGITYTYQWYKADVAIEGATKATYEITETASYKCVVTASVEGLESVTGSASGSATFKVKPVAAVNGTNYGTLAEAVAAANAIEGGATVTLLDDVTLGEKLTIASNVTISGEKTITRADSYTGTLFEVAAGATLTLDGGLIIDGANNYAFDRVAFDADAADWNKSIAKEDSAKWFTPEEGAPVATAYMITTTGGTINLNKVTIQNNYSVNYGVVSAGANSTVNLTGAKITHVAATQNSGVAVNASGAGINVNVNNGTVIDGNHVGGNHGLFKIYSGATLTMYGGEITNNTGWNSNGTVVGVYWGTFNMKGGKICSNIGVYGPSNGRNAAIYLHSGHNFEMTGGIICHNSGRSRGGIDAPYDNGTALIKGGEVLDNISRSNGNTQDVLGTTAMQITGGTFTQDVSQWLAPNCGLSYNADSGRYSVVNEGLYKLHLTDPNTGEPATIPYIESNDLASLVATGKLFYADYYKMELEVLYDVKVDKTVVVDYPMTINLNGKTLTATADVDPMFRIESDVIFTGSGKVDARNGVAYAFIVGKTDGTVGNLTINGDAIYYGETTVASVTNGKLIINGGKFAVNPYEGSYEYTLNCIDANYKNGSAKIEVKGGKFYKFNPANNAAEGANTNFAADGYKAEADGDYYTVRVDKDALPAIATITFKNGADNGNELTLKYPSERFNSIQHLIGTNNYADFEFGAEVNELLAYAAQGKATDIVMTLHDDIVLEDTLYFYDKYFQMDAQYDLTLDLNGHKITVADSMNAKPAIRVLSNVTVKNGTIDATAGTSTYAFIVGQGENDGKLTIVDGNYKGAVSAVSITKGTVNITGGNFEATPYEGKYEFLLNCIDANYKNGTAVYNVTGGTFKGFNPENNAAEGAGTDFVPKGYAAIDNGDGTWTVKEQVNVTVKVADASMVAGNALPKFTYTIEGATADEVKVELACAADGKTAGEFEITATVTAAEKYKVTVEKGTLTVNTAVAKISRDGETLYFATLQDAYDAAKNNNNINVLQDVVLTETLVCDENKAVYIKMEQFDLTGDLDTLIKLTAGTLRVSCAGEIKNTGDVFNVDGGKLVLYGAATVTSDNSNCLYIRSGSAELQKAKLIANGEYPAIQGNGNYTGNVAIQGGSVTATKSDIAIYWPQNGMLTVTGGTIKGETALYAKSGTIVINGGEFIATGAKADFAHSSNGAAATGDAVVIESCMDAAYETPKVTINGGKFVSANANAVMFYDCAGTGKAADIMELTGGNYSSMPDVEWCVAGKAPVLNDNNMWEISEFIATVDGIHYNDWAKAKAAIKGESVIVLYDDIVNPAGFSYGAANKTFTLDLNGHKFTTKNMGLDGHKTLHIIDSAEGGSVVVTDYVGLYANGYLNIDSDVNFTGKLQFNYNSGSTGCLLIDGKKVIGRGHFAQTTDGIFGTTGGYVTLTNGLENINFISGSFTLNEDYEVGSAQTVTIGKNTTLTVDAVLTLNAASNVTINGKVQGEGKVVVNTIDQFKTILNTDIVNIKLGSAMILDDELKIDEQVVITGMANFSQSENGKLILTAGTYDKDVQTYCAEGYAAIDNGNGTWTVKEQVNVTVKFDDITMVDGNELPKFTYTTNFTEVAGDGKMLIVEEPVVNVNGVGEYVITAEASVFMSDKYVVEVIPGKLTVQEANVEINGTYYNTIQAALDAVDPHETATIKVLKDHTITDDQRMFNNYSVVINAEYITLDLNGKTVTFDYAGNSKTVYAALAIYNGGSLKIVDSSEAQTGTLYNKTKISSAPRIVWVTSAGSLVVEGGRFISEQADTMFYTSNSNKNVPTTLYIKGGYFEHTIPTDSQTWDYFNKKDDDQKQIIELFGGTFKHKPTEGHQNDWEVKIPEGYAAVANNDGTWTVKEQVNVTVKVDNISMVAGNALPTFTYTIEGATADEVKVELACAADGKTAGEYDITANVTAPEKYKVTVVPGKLTVETALIRAYAANNAKVKYFTSLNEALEYAASTNDYVPVTILGDITVDETIVFNDKSANTIELQAGKTGSGTYTITATADPFIKMESGRLNIKNLKINTKGDSFYVTGGELNLNYHSKGKQFIEVISQTGNCVYVRGGNVNVNGAKLTALGEYPAIQGNGTFAGNVTLNKWNIGDGTYPEISAPNSDIAIYWPQNGTLTVEGGKITGDTALYAKSGTIVINGGEFSATGAKADFAHSSNGAVATGDAVVIESCKDAAYETPKVTINGGKFASANANAVMFYDCAGTEKAADIMKLTGGVYSSMPNPDWCVEGKGPKHNNDEKYPWTIGVGKLSVDRVMFDSWDNAESSIKKNSTIVLYDDVVNYYGGTVARDYKFPANGGNITLNLNGHSFASKMSDASKVTSVSIQYGTTLNVIGGGTIEIENGSYPFVVNPRSTLKIADGVKFIGTMQFNYNNGSGDVYMGDTHLIGQDGHFKPNEVSRIVMTEAGDWTLGMGSLTMMADDAILANNTLTINQKCAVDLNGKNLTAKSIAAFGNLIDTQDGVGTVTTTGDYYYTNHANSDYLPLHDAAGGCYRLYKTEVKTRGVKVVDADTLKYGYTIYFNVADAYKLLGEMIESNQFSLAVDWTGAESGFTYDFSDTLLKKFADKAYEQMETNRKVTTSMTYNMYGVSELAIDDVIETTPFISAEIGVVVSGEVHTYTIS